MSECLIDRGREGNIVTHAALEFGIAPQTVRKSVFSEIGHASKNMDRVFV